jgi:hypothetical protein
VLKKICLLLKIKIILAGYSDSAADFVGALLGKAETTAILSNIKLLAGRGTPCLRETIFLKFRKAKISNIFYVYTLFNHSQSFLL